jgi:L-fuculose-phosphate aldolase
MNVVRSLSTRANSLSESDPRFRIAAARRILHREGVDSQIGGHVSLRVPGEDAFYVTPYQYFDETLPEHVMKVGFDLKVREPGTFPASPGINFHASLYMARPDVNCVIHTHGRNAVLVSALGKPPAPHHVYASLFYGDCSYFKDDPSMTPDEEGAALAECLGPRRALLMSHHGAVHAGVSLEVATVEALVMEFCCGIQLDALKIGAPPLDEQTAKSYRNAYLKYGFHQQMWDANYRRLCRSDPDLFQLLS